MGPRWQRAAGDSDRSLFPRRPSRSTSEVALAELPAAPTAPVPLRLIDGAGVEPVTSLSPGRRWSDLAAEERETARRRLQDRISGHARSGRVRVVLTDNLRTMVTVRKGQDVTTFRLHHMFLEAPSVVLRALAAYAHDHDRRASRVLQAFIDTCEGLVRRDRRGRAPTIDTEGRHHDLQAIFEELNLQYFSGRIRARITWGVRGRRRRGRSSIKLGSYVFDDDLIRIHPVLDAVDVPRFFVEWVVYHEMLHEVHDIPFVGGRHMHHTPEFRRAEAKFAHYGEAVAWERAHVHTLLDR